MTTNETPFLHRLLRLAALGALAVAVLVWPLAWLLSGQARTLQYVVPADDALIQVNRLDYAESPTGKDADIIALYGTPSGEPETVLFVSDADIIHPEEKPALALLMKRAEENPLQLATVWFAARMTSLGAFAAFLASVLLLGFLRRRRSSRQPVDGPTVPA